MSIFPQAKPSATPFTKGKKGEGPKRPGGAFMNGTGGHTATGTAKGTIVTGKKTAPKGAMRMSSGK